MILILQRYIYLKIKTYIFPTRSIKGGLFMKAWKFLSAPLMLMLLTCLQGNAAAADVTETVKAGFDEGQEQHVTVNSNVKVEGSSEAVYVKSNAPESAEDKSASARINGNVSTTNQGATTAIFADAYDGDASAYVTGNVSAKANCVAKGIRAWGNGYNEGKSGIVEVGGDVTAESLTYATGVDSDNGRVYVKGNVTAKTNDDGQSACGVESCDDENITIEGNVKAQSKNDAEGLYAETCEKTSIDVKGSVSATGKNSIGLKLISYRDYYGESGGQSDPQDEGQGLGNLSVTIGNGVTATSTNTDEEAYAYSRAVSFSNYGKNLSVDITGDVVAKSPIGNAVGIVTNHDGGYDGEFNEPFSNGKSEILVHGNVISDGVGIAFDTLGEDTDVNVLVENEIKAKNVGVMVKKSYYANEDSNTEPKLTVWKIQLNDRGNVAETIVTNEDDPLGDDGHSETNVTAAKDFEKHIMYIIKVEQPGEGGTIKALDKNGNKLLKSYDFDVAHEGDKVILKANLADGYKLIAAYNGKGKKVPLLKDANGNYYIIVPKGGGVYLSVELEGTNENYGANNDSDMESITEPVSVSSTTSGSGSEALKTGDVSQVAPWIVLSLVSAGEIAGLEISNKKNKFKK